MAPILTTILSNALGALNNNLNQLKSQSKNSGLSVGQVANIASKLQDTLQTQQSGISNNGKV